LLAEKIYFVVHSLVRSYNKFVITQLHFYLFYKTMVGIYKYDEDNYEKKNEDKTCDKEIFKI